MLLGFRLPLSNKCDVNEFENKTFCCLYSESLDLINILFENNVTFQKHLRKKWLLRKEAFI